MRTTQASLTSRSSARRVSARTLSDGFPRRRSARALDRLIHLSHATAATTWKELQVAEIASLPRRPVLAAAPDDNVVLVWRSRSSRRRPAHNRRGSVSECRARLVEINCQSGKGLRCCAGLVRARIGSPRRAAQAIKVSEVAPLRQREHSVLQLRWAPFGRARSCARARRLLCQGTGAASMRTTQASLTSRSSARRVGAARCRTASRAGAQRAR